MIHARVSQSDNAFEPVLHLSFVGVLELKRLQSLLARSLNCAPEFGKDYFELSDRLDSLIASHELSRIDTL